MPYFVPTLAIFPSVIILFAAGGCTTHYGEGTIIEKKVTIEEDGDLVYHFVIKTESGEEVKVRHVGKKMFEETSLGDKVTNFTNFDGIISFDRVLSVEKLESENSLRAQCVKAFCEKYGIGEEAHKFALERDPDWRLKWEAFQTEWCRNLVSLER